MLPVEAGSSKELYTGIHFLNIRDFAHVAHWLVTTPTKGKEFAEISGAIVNPILMEREFDNKTTMWRKDRKDGRRHLTKIEFDIAITASNEDATAAGGGFKIQVLNLGASAANKEINQVSSRIKFDLNVALPHQGDQ